MVRMTLAEVQKLLGDNTHKYRAIKTEVDGIKFPSRAEANRYCNLKTLQKAGEILWFIRQPMFDLPGGTSYRADFLIVWTDGKITIEDVKGYKTKTYRIKKKQVESLYPVKIVEVEG